MTRSFSAFMLLSCLLAHAQQDPVVVPGEPANLEVVKEQLKAYYACSEANCYRPQLERQADVAIRYLKDSSISAKPGERLAVVLDIDETALSNWAVELHDDFGYIPTDSNWCVALRCGKAIPATMRIFQEAKKINAAVFFITGRPEKQRFDTEENLKAEGFAGWEQVYLRPDIPPAKQTVVQYKSGARAKIVAAGYRIVLNVGDQMSDLNGEPKAEHSVKLPNPFYFIP